MVNLGRRIRVKALLLSGARKDSGALGRWVKWEIARGLVPAFAAVGLHFAGLAMPLWFALILILGGLGWMAFVLWNTAGAALALNRRREAWFIARGMELDPSLMKDQRAWKMALAGRSLREFLKDRAG